MSDPRTAHTQPPGNGSRALRLLGLAAVAVGVLILVAAAFVLSYAGIHAVALSAGVSPRLARLYPVIFDAMLVVACAAVLLLRGAGRPSRCYAWLTMLVLLVAAAGADTLHATAASLPHKPAAAAAAIIPWALVLIGFGLLLAILRQARLRLAAGQDDEGLLEPAGRTEVSGGIDALFGPRPSPGSDVSPARNGYPVPAEPPVLSEPPAPNGSPGPNGSPAPAQPPARADSTTQGESPAPGFVPVPAEPSASAESPAPAKSSTPVQSPASAESPDSKASPALPMVTAAPLGGGVAPAPATDHAAGHATGTEPGQDDPTGDEGSTPSSQTREQQPAGFVHQNGDAKSAFSPAPALAPSDAETGEWGTEAEPELEAQAEPEAKTEPETQPAPGTGTPPEIKGDAEPETEADAGPEPGSTRPQLESGPELESAGPELESAGTQSELTGTEPAGEDQPEPSPAPALATAQFERMQSSPAPPDARSAPVP